MIARWHHRTALSLQQHHSSTWSEVPNGASKCEPRSLTVCAFSPDDWRRAAQKGRDGSGLRSVKHRISGISSPFSICGCAHLRYHGYIKNALAKLLLPSLNAKECGRRQKAMSYFQLPLSPSGPHPKPPTPDRLFVTLKRPGAAS